MEAIDALKQKILSLAIQGKLVPQDPNDEPASELLKKIKAEKAELVKQGKIKKDKQESRIYKGDDNKYYEQIGSETKDITEEIPFEIPNNWEWVRLGSIMEIARGGSPRPIQDYLTTDENGLNWIKIGDTDKGGKYINSTKEKIKPEGLKKTRMVHKGDFLLTNSMSFGRPYILNIDGCIHDGWLVISDISNSYSVDFVYYLLSSSFAYNQFCGKVSGAVVSNLNSDKVASSIFPLPPLSEQKRIVSEIEKIFKQIEVVKENQEELSKLKDGLKNKILDLAIQGKLVEQDPNDEPASELLKKIKAEKAELVKQGKIKKDKQESYIFKGADNRHYEQIGSETKDITEEIPFDIPNNWKWCRMVNITKQIHYGYTASAKSEGCAKLLRITDIQNNSVSWNNVPFCDISPKDLSNYKLELRDILIARTGGTVGKSYIIKEINSSSVFASYLIRLIPVFSINEDYIKLFLESPLYWKQLKEKSMGTGQPNVNGEALKSLLIPIPPITEQSKIVRKITAEMCIINSL